MVYAMLGNERRPLYVGLTKNLRARTAGHYRSPWFDRVRRIGVRYLASRYEAMALEVDMIRKLRPEFNVDAPLMCQVLTAHRSGRTPHSHNPIGERMKGAPFFFADAGSGDGFDRVFVRDRQSEAAGFDQANGRPFIKPGVIAHDDVRHIGARAVG